MAPAAGVLFPARYLILPYPECRPFKKAVQGAVFPNAQAICETPYQFTFQLTEENTANDGLRTPARTSIMGPLVLKKLEVLDEYEKTEAAFEEAEIHETHRAETGR